MDVPIMKPRSAVVEHLGAAVLISSEAEYAEYRCLTQAPFAFNQKPQVAPDAR